MDWSKVLFWLITVYVLWSLLQTWWFAASLPLWTKLTSSAIPAVVMLAAWKMLY